MKKIIKITFNDLEGSLNIETQEVYFYHLKYQTIIDAIKNVEIDILNHQKEIEIVDKIITNLICFQTT